MGLKDITEETERDDAMNDWELSKLHSYEAVIEKNLKAFYEEGHALKKIRDNRPFFILIADC